REYPDTEIQALNEAISPQQGREIAIAKGHERKATIVLWGWYKQIRGNISLTVHFDPVQDIPLDLRANQLTRVFPTSEIESFTIQVQLSKEMAYLTLLTMGMARLLADDYDGAIERLTHALERGDAPDQLVQSSLLYLARGWAYLQRSNFSADSRRSRELGIADLKRTTQLDDKEPVGYMLLGLAYLQAEEPDKALDAANKTTALSTDTHQQAFAAYLAASAHTLKGENEKAKQYAARAIEILDSLPPYEAKFALLSIVYLIVDDNVRAASSLTQAANLSSCGQNKVYYAFERGVIYADSGNLDKAIEELDSSIRMRPDFARAYWARGQVYVEKKDHKRAIGDYDTAIKLDPTVAEFYDDRGDARLALDQWEQAIADYKKATVVDPHFALGFYDLGLAYSRRKLFHEAIDSITRYITLEPDDWDGYQLRQEMYQSTGEFDLAIADANQMFRIKPNEAFTFIVRGGIYQHKGDFKSSINDYSLYIKAKPRDAWAYQMRAWVYQKDEQFDKAIDDFAVAITLKPDDASIYIYRGSAYMAAGKEELAVSDFKKVLELTKDPKLTKIAESELEIIRKDREALEMKTRIKPD
ncbi:MAG TPA: tetratricopeptide repeat protein, partial [Pyrinomonadaceae bacterium]|nr:tetratricopeptide repeat protein [Pyrinomonadaceae bacterium]